MSATYADKGFQKNAPDDALWQYFISLNTNVHTVHVLAPPALPLSLTWLRFTNSSNVSQHNTILVEPPNATFDEVCPGTSLVEQATIQRHEDSCMASSSFAGLSVIVKRGLSVITARIFVVLFLQISRFLNIRKNEISQKIIIG